ncbi:helix-turn-helix transcriptional regulator [Agromyces bauzanensis]
MEIQTVRSDMMLPPRRASSGRLHSASRERLLRLLEAQRGPSSLAALARVTGLHENTVRGHLESLQRDGFVTRRRGEASGRGRPAWLWQAVRRDASSPYAPLAGVLAATLLRTSADPVGDAREAGRLWGRELVAVEADGADAPASTDVAAARGTVVDLMREQGFAPEPLDDHETILLRRCPLIEAASRHPEVVCAVHLGMVDGALQSLGVRDAVATLDPFTGPSECTLRVRASR